MSHELAAGGHIFSRTSVPKHVQSSKEKSHRNIYVSWYVVLEKQLEFWDWGGGGGGGVKLNPFRS